MENSKKSASTAQETMTESITQTPKTNQVSRSIPMNSIISAEDYKILGDGIKKDFPFVLFGVNDDSMEPKISKGDTIIVRIQDVVNDGEIAVISINDQIICRKIKKSVNGIILIPTNTKYEIKFYSKAEMNDSKIMKVVGVIKEVRSTY